MAEAVVDASTDANRSHLEDGEKAIWGA